jgi:hypothetical protein
MTLKRATTIFVAIIVAVVVHAQTRIPVRILVEKKEATTRQIKQQAQVIEQRGEYHTPRLTDVTQRVTLTIKVHNMGATEAKGLEVRYALIGRRVDTKQIEVVATSARPTDVKASQILPLPLEPVDFVTEETFYVGGSSQWNRSTGLKYYGVAVAVFRGQEKLTSYFDPKELQQQTANLGVGF